MEDDVSMASPEKSPKLDDGQAEEMDHKTTAVTSYPTHNNPGTSKGMESGTSGTSSSRSNRKSKSSTTEATSSVYCWGNHGEGQLGLGGIEQEQIFSPHLLQALDGKQLRSVACGGQHTLFLTHAGTVYSCGNNDGGQLGREHSHKRPECVRGLDTQQVRGVACGLAHNVVMNEAGQLFTWGSNTQRQLGHMADLAICMQPKLVQSLSSTARIVQVACGSHHVIALGESGEVYTWGCNTNGALGVGPRVGEMTGTPQLVSSVQGIAVRQVAAGGAHSFLLSRSGAVYGWGKNNHGQLGTIDEKDKYFPTQCKTLRAQKIKYIACGQDHTAVLTKDGGVFTFGAGMYGQLGHNTSINESLPRKVFELMGSTVTQIACGRAHTLAYVASARRLYTFGLGGNGQLGTGNSSKHVSPYSVDMAFLPSPSSSTVTSTLTGGDASFMLLSHTQENVEGSDYREVIPSTQILTLNEECLSRLQDVKSNEKCATTVKDVERIFTSASCICASFMKEGDQHCSRKWHGVDIDAARDAFDRIHQLPNQQLTDTIYKLISTALLPSLRPPPDLEAMRLYLSLPMCSAFLEPKLYADLICPFATAVLSLEGPAAGVMDDWWSSLKPSIFKRHVTIYKQVVVHILSEPKPSSDFQILVRQRSLQVCLKVLKRLNAVNEKQGQIIRYDQFYIPEMLKKVDIQVDYRNWLRQGQGTQTPSAGASGGLLTFCDYPFVFDAEAKTVLLQMDAMIQMETAMDEVHRRNLTSLFIPSINPINPCLVLYISRSNLVADTIAQLTKQGNCDFKKPLKVLFLGEEAQDAGGVRKEFFMLLLREVLDPKYGMFVEKEESRLIWFNGQTFEENQMFTLIGLLCGLAIYNATIINLNFPVALYKKLLKRPIILEDMEELDPVVGRSLASLLDYPDDDVPDVFCLTFSISREVYGSMQEVELVPNGSKIMVTKENREKYVEAYIDYVFNSSVEEQFKAFNDGFHKVCGGRVIELFHPIELQSMVIGNEDYDWDELRNSTVYKGEYYANHPTIKLFWEVFQELPIQHKKKFLLFLTGSDRIPIHGMKAVQIKIQPTGGGEDFLPVAHTCFNLLDLPKYQHKEILESKLLTAIQHAEGFGIA